MAESLNDLEVRLLEARRRRQELITTVEPSAEREAELEVLDEEIRSCEGEIWRQETHQRAASSQAKEAAEKKATQDSTKRTAKGLMGCGVPLLVAGFIAIAATALGLRLFDDDAKCSPQRTTLGNVGVQLVAECDPEPTPTTPSTSAPTDDRSGTGTTMPDAADLPPGQVLYRGTSGSQLGCIACDGQSRFIHITRSTTALGDAERAGQEIVWPENGEVVDFGIRIPQPNEGRYGINLFVNGAYSVGCPIETGSSACRVLEGQDPSPLKAGDRVTIIVGEQGILDKNGAPAEEGDFVLEWWFVFQPGSA